MKQTAREYRDHIDQVILGITVEYIKRLSKKYGFSKDRPFEDTKQLIGIWTRSEAIKMYRLIRLTSPKTRIKKRKPLWYPPGATHNS